MPRPHRRAVHHRPSRGAHRVGLLLGSLASAACALFSPCGAEAQPKPKPAAPAAPAAPSKPEPEPTSAPQAPADFNGLERPAVEAHDAALDVAAAFLWLPRQTVRLVFLASGTAAIIIRDQQVVPRVTEYLEPPPGDLAVFPVVLVDSRRRASFGAQLIASGSRSATRFSVGFGGVHDLVAESRLLFTGPKPIPFVFGVEALFDSRSRLEYIGLGQKPEEDPRNHFRRDAPSHEAYYWEERSRAIADLGVRLGTNIEAIVSSSFTYSRVTDPPDHDPQSMSRVFVPGSVVGGLGKTSVVYTEAAMRLDTRPTLGRPSPGILLEGYGGFGEGFGDVHTNYGRLGGRAGVSIPILRKSNILTPQIVIDGLFAPDSSVPFTQLVTQPTYRGLDDRRDHLSYVVSVDYRYSVLPYLGARAFLDLAAVGADIGTIFKAPPRPAIGFGFDLYSASTVLGNAAVAFSPDGVNFFLSFGIPQQFGDRQHRY